MTFLIYDFHLTLNNIIKKEKESKKKILYQCTYILQLYVNANFLHKKFNRHYNFPTDKNYPKYQRNYLSSPPFFYHFRGRESLKKYL